MMSTQTMARMVAGSQLIWRTVGKQGRPPEGSRSPRLGSLSMHSIARYVWCLILLTCTSLSQNAKPSTPAQELLTKGKQLYTQEGPKAALPQFEEAIKMFRSSNDRHGEADNLGY